MSKQIDERVVSMQFDNQRFERNVQTSMSTLDKLKQKLNLSGASKGLESVQSAANKVDMSGLSNSVETVRTRFSALEVMGVTALANITNSAVNAGKRMLSALTIDPVKDGFSEYEMTLNAVQTTMAGTGKTAEEVEKELKKLDEYADKTVYSTSDMLNNLPKFTNAGVELESATKAMIGIANATALAGGDAGKASIAFYNLGQAIGTGYLTRMDYNSINTAGIATMEWKNQMVEAAIAQGTLTKVGEDAYKAGNKTLTLQQLFIDGLQEQWATTDVLMKVFGDYGDETTAIGEKAYSAAQDIKTFSQMTESLKATAGTGWKDTWQLIFGDLEGAKKLWTGLSNFISNIITKMADIRNGILESALGKSFTALGEKIKGVLKPVQTTAKSVKTVTDAVKDYSKVVNEIINGDWGNGQSRWNKLTEAGYDWAHAQNLVNEKLGCSVRHATNYKEAQDAVNASQTKGAEVSSKLSKADADRIADLCKLSDAELEALGYTKEQIEAFRELEKTAKKLGLPISEFIQKIDEIDGRWLLLEAFANIGRSVAGVFKAMGKAWQEIFNPNHESMVQKIAEKLFNLIAAFHKFTRSLLLTNPETGKLNANGDKLVRTFKGIFAIFDIVKTIVGGPLKLAFKILTKILGAFGLNILDVTAFIGDAIVKFRDWFKSVFNFNGVIKKLTPYLKKAAAAIKEFFAGMKDTAVVKTVSKYTKSAAKSVKNWFKTLKDNGALKTFVSYAKKAGAVMKEWFAALKETKLFKMLSKYVKSSATSIKEWFSGLKEADNIPKYIIQGLVNGLKSGIKMAASIVKELAITILDTIKGILGIHSPSTEFYDIGKNVILGLFNGIKDFVTMIYDLIMAIGGKVIEIVKSFDVGSVITAFVGSGFVIGFVKIANAFESLTGPLEGVGEILTSTAKVVKSFSKVLGSVGNWVNAQALKTVAISIAILVASVALLTFLNPGKVWASIGAIAALALILGGLTVAIGKFGPEEGMQFGKMAVMLLGMAAAILIIAKALKTIASINHRDMEQALYGFGAIVAGMISIMGAFTLFSKKGKNIEQVGAVLFKMAAAMAIMAIVIKLLGSMETETLIKGELAVAGMVGIMALMMLITKIGNTKKVGDMLKDLAKTIALLALCVAVLGNMETETLIKGEAAILTLVGIMAVMMLITKIGNAKKVGSMLMQMAGAIAIMALVVGILGTMEVETLIKGEAAILSMVGIIALMILAVKQCGKDVAKIGTTILAISVAVALLAGVAVLLGMVSLPNLIKGVAAVAVLATLAAGLVVVTKFAGADCYKSMLGIAIAIGVMAAAVAVMSFLDPANLIVATLCMSLLIGMLSLLVKATEKANGSLKVLIVITIAMGMLGVLLLLLSKMPIASTIVAAVSLSVLLGAMILVLYALDKMNLSVGNALKGVVGLLALCIPLVAIAGILCLMNCVKDAITSVNALNSLLVTMTVVLVVLTIIGNFAVSALLGVTALLALCIPLVAIAGILCLMNCVKDAMTNALALGLLMQIMGDVCFKLALVGPLALVGVTAVAALTALIAAVGVLAVAIGALMELCPQLESFIDKGLAIMIKLAGGIGEMIGAFIGGALEQIADSLPAIGSCLSQFMANAMMFVEGAKQVDEKVLAGVGILTAAILLLTAADFINGILSFLQGGSSFADLGTQLSLFMTNAMPFIIGAKMIDPEIMTSIKTLADALLILTAANLLESLTSWFSGGSGVDMFTQSLPKLGSALLQFSNSVAGINAEQVTAASNAAKNLAEMTKAVPNEGGIKSWFSGDSGVALFAANLPKVGDALLQFSNSVAGVNPEQVTAASNAAKNLAEMTKAVPNEGGVKGWFSGESGVALFAENMPKLGDGLLQFSNSVAGVNPELVTTAVDAAKSIVEMTKAIPNEGGVKGWFSGESGVATFAANMPKLGDGLLQFSNSVAGVNPEQVTAASNAAKSLVEMTKAIPNKGGIKSWFSGESGVATFAANMPKVGDALLQFSNSVAGMNPEAVDKAVLVANDLVALTKNAPGDTDNLDEFGKGLKKFGNKLSNFFEDIGNLGSGVIEVSGQAITAISSITTSIDGGKLAETAEALGDFIIVLNACSNIKENSMSGFVAAVKELGNLTVDSLLKTFKQGNTEMVNAGKKLISKFVDGLKAKKSSAKKAASNVIKEACSAIKSESNYSKFKKAGKYLGEGLVKGIKAKEDAVYRAAYKLGQKAVQGEKDGQESKSPSKATIKAGKWLGEGLVIGIQRMGKQVYKTGYSLGETATGTISKAVSNISSIVNSDIDAQPTIRPVLDLSDVRAGAGSINALFSGRTLAVDMAGVGAVSASMSGFQNGSDSKEIVSGIKALRKDIANMPRNTYNVNGVTYDDGSNVSNTVGELVRAIKIERRT